jgi:hypothetical protein
MTLRIFVFVSALVAICSAYFNWHHQLDDALIYYRYVENTLQGNGLVYNIGERHNALTSPFYTYLFLAFSYVSGGHIHASAIVLSVFSQLAIAVAFFFCFRDKLPKFALFLMPFLLFGTHYFYTVYGMETLLYLALALACFPLFEKQRWGWLGIVAVLMVLTRSEMVFLLLALGIEHRLRRFSFPPLKAYVVPALLCIAHFGFNYFYYGALLPHSADVKTTQAKSGIWGDGLVFLILDYHVSFFAKKHLFMWVSIVTGVVGLWAYRRTLFLRPWLVFLLLYSAFYVGCNIPNYHWYYAPYYLTFVIGQVGLVALAYQYRKPLGIALAVALLVMQMTILYKAGRRYPHAEYMQIGLWLAANTPKDAHIGAAEIGHVGWYSKRYMVDMIGLVTLKNAGWLAERKFDQWVIYYKPDYIGTVNKPVFL